MGRAAINYSASFYYYAIFYIRPILLLVGQYPPGAVKQLLYSCIDETM
jgi:hypothetical protein